ncbi:MAG: S-layer protein [Planctomycetaceae bacterium]|nr:S-layer protein [Planctomycetaceae bacterium]
MYTQLRSVPPRLAVQTCWLIVCLSASNLVIAGDVIRVLPAEAALSGPEASHRIIVHETQGDELTRQVREGVKFEPSDAKIVTVDNGVLRPVANGTTSVTVSVGEQRAELQVRVSGMQTPHEWSFRNHVQAVITKAGCNAGACHGALAGKGGFKLSLRGYDTNRDHHTITRQARGRRIELADPGRSLLLAKPTGALAHKGGMRFEVDSLEYKVLAEWISAGAPSPAADDARLERIQVLPERSILQPGDSQQMIVQAFYADGRIEDVTPWAKFASTHEAVASVTPQGEVSVMGYGEGAVTAWFASEIVIARVTSPYANEVADKVYADLPKRNFIDELVGKQLRRLNLPPSPPASDAEFLRRAYLDTIGTLPTIQQTRAFLADASEDKRDRVIDELLSRPEFVDYWTYKWSDLLLLNGTLLRPQAVKAYYEWIHGHVKANTPWDVFVREVVTSQGSSFENGATNFYALHQDPETMSENVSQAFLGLSIGCAKCHNHPLEKWTNNQYYAMANLFARVRAKGWGGDSRSGDGKRTLFVVDKGDLVQPLTGKPQPPSPLDGEALAFESTDDRRVHLANWLTSPENPYFARSITNRVWANFFGVGLVESVDDMRASNPASNDELLAAAAKHVVDSKFDLKSLMRIILQSHTYQRSSQPLPGNKDEQRFYSRYYPRRLMAEVLLDAISQVSDVPTDFTEVEYPGADRQKTDFYPKGTRALQLYDSAVASYFLKTFGRNDRQITCECERSDEPSMVQVLHISNGDTLNKKLSAEGNRIDKLLKSGVPNYVVIENAFLLASARYPTDDEMQQLLSVMNSVPKEEHRIVVEDLFWSVLSSREFLFNH